MILFIRNFFYKNRFFISEPNSLDLSKDAIARMKKTTVKLSGQGNQLVIAKGAVITNCEIRLSGKNNKIYIGENVRFRSGKIYLKDTENQTISIGADTTVEGAYLLVDEAASIKIGQDCMLSTDIIIRVGDKHSILDSQTKLRINPAKDVILEDRVWLGRAVQILKGTHLQPETVVGACSVVTSKFSEGHCVVAGMPARIVKKNTHWHRDLI